ncbi:MAG TPA: threonine/serine exporter family protein [Blastocatellia bacterium]|nr:threonine/serine exporter family protein [Blastocatellia bacterium]
MIEAPLTHRESDESSRPPQQEAIGFILSLGRALHIFGYPAYRLEELLESAAEKLGLKGQFFATPTSVYCGFGELDEQRTYLIRIEPGDVNLGKLVDLDEVTSNVVCGRITPARGSELVQEITASRSPYRWPLRVLSYSLASAASARIIGGGIKEIIVSGIIGLVIGMLSLLAGRVSSLSFVLTPVAAFIASVISNLLSRTYGPYSVFNATLAGLIVLLPGLTLTMAMAELSTRNLVSGVSRLSAALIVLIGMGFGVDMGTRVAIALSGPPRIGNPVHLSWWTEWAALLILPVAFTVLLRAHFRDSVWILLTGLVAVAASRSGSLTIGPELGPFLGAVAVGVVSRAYSQFLKRPSTVTLLPGLLLLVPGSIGFRSIISMLDSQIVPGIETAFGMILMAMALVTGVLTSSLILPVRER